MTQLDNNAGTQKIKEKNQFNQSINEIRCQLHHVTVTFQASRWKVKRTFLLRKILKSFLPLLAKSVP